MGNKWSDLSQMRLVQKAIRANALAVAQERVA